MPPASDQVVIGCESCGASLQLAANQRSTVCPYCASGSVVERPPTMDRPTPIFTLGFVLAEEEAARRLGQWIKQRGFFTHGAFKKAPLERLRGVYLPAYLYGGIARAEYQVEIGEHYTVTEMKDGSVKRTTKTEWRPLSGHYATWVQDVVVTASSAIPNQELEAIEPFDLRTLKRYRSALIAGWIAEDASVEKQTCLETAREEAHAAVHRSLAAFMPGDKHRGLKSQLRMEREVLELLLAPVWVSAVRYAEDKPPVRLLMNGQSGKITGRPPLSTTKIVITILLAVAAVGGLIFWIWWAAQQ